MAEIKERSNGVYTIDNLKCLSVTHVLDLIDKPFLKLWYGKVGTQAAEKVKRDSCDIGSFVDDYIMQYFTGIDIPPFKITEPELVSKKDTAIKNFARFVDMCQPKSVLSQQLVYWDKNDEETAGTLDAVIEVDGNFCREKTSGLVNVLVDWKVANQISEQYIFQIQTYFHFLMYCVEKGYVKLNKQPHELWIVRFDKEKEFKWSRDVIQMKPDAKVFENFLNLRRFYNGMKYVKELMRKR